MKRRGERNCAIAAWVLVAGCKTVIPAAANEPIPIDGEAARLEGTRYMEYRVGVNVGADPDTIWAILTDAPSYPTWNSTVVKIDGTIAEGQDIELVAKIDPDRTFPLTVSHFSPPNKLVWEDGRKAFKGARTFTITQRSDGTSDVTMAEVLTGTFLPMIKKKLPDLSPSMAAFAADLKTAAEKQPAP